MADHPGLLAKGPWSTDQVQAQWLPDPYVPSEDMSLAADIQLERLKQRDSPAHDGLAARLDGFSVEDGQLKLRLQAARWALRLIPQDEINCISSLCVVRSASGEWLAGKRAPWVASWAGRWALGAGGAVEIGESPVDTLSRELLEEWSVTPKTLNVSGLIQLPNRSSMLIGLAWLEDGAEVVPDAEHDDFMWLPADVQRWPEYADAPLRLLASLLSKEH